MNNFPQLTLSIFSALPSISNPFWVVSHTSSFTITLFLTSSITAENLCVPTSAAGESSGKPRQVPPQATALRFEYASHASMTDDKRFPKYNTCTRTWLPTCRSEKKQSQKERSCPSKVVHMPRQFYQVFWEHNERNKTKIWRNNPRSWSRYEVYLFVVFFFKVALSFRLCLRAKEPYKSGPLMQQTLKHVHPGQ